MVEATIIDREGNERYKIEGKFSDELFGYFLEKPNEKTSLFKAPEMPPDNHLMYGLNYYALQLNVLSPGL
jgi:hypothetical protein